MKTVAIVGVGLIGGSLGRALRRTRRYRVIGIGRRPSALALARRLGAIDLFSTRPEAVAIADIVVLCTPMALMQPFAKKLLPFMKAGAWLTDAGSVKAPVLQMLAPMAARYGVHFAGGHPLAGSHRAGVNASRIDLFRGATCVIVRNGKSDPAPILRLWRDAGAKPLLLSAAAHDAALALTSHLPHLIAHALVLSVARRRDRALLKKLMAGSFRDVTRVASADPEQWAQIFRSNAASVRAALGAFTRELRGLGSSLKSARLKREIQRSHRFRKPLFSSAS